MVLFEFRGQLSVQDIYTLTYKELTYLRQHRKRLMSDSKLANADAAQALVGM